MFSPASGIVFPKLTSELKEITNKQVDTVVCKYLILARQ